MANKPNTHTVRSTTSKGKIKLENIELIAPASVDDPRWADLVDSVEEHVNDLAFANWIIKWQDKVREILPDAGAGPKAKEKALKDALDLANGGWKFGGKVTRARVDLRDKMDELGLTEEQIKILEAAGARLK